MNDFIICRFNRIRSIQLHVAPIFNPIFALISRRHQTQRILINVRSFLSVTWNAREKKKSFPSWFIRSHHDSCARQSTGFFFLFWQTHMCLHSHCELWCAEGVIASTWIDEKIKICQSNEHSKMSKVKAQKTSRISSFVTNTFRSHWNINIYEIQQNHKQTNEGFSHDIVCAVRGNRKKMRKLYDENLHKQNWWTRKREFKADFFSFSIIEKVKMLVCIIIDCVSVRFSRCCWPIHLRITRVKYAFARMQAIKISN